MRRYFILGLLLCASAGSAKTPESRVAALAAQGQWLGARELGEELLKQDPGNAQVKRALEALDEKVRRNTENLDFDPKKYFHAQAYVDFFSGHYAQAVEDLEQVLVFELENEEALQFMDKAQALLSSQAKAMLGKLPGLYRASKYKEGIELSSSLLAISPHSAEAKDWLKRMQTGQVSVLLGDLPALFDSAQYAQALETCQNILALDPSNTPAKLWADKIDAALHPALTQASAPVAAIAPAVLPKPAPPVMPRALPAPSQEWIDEHYRQALKAYVQHDLIQARGLLRELLARDPANPRCKKALERIQKELP